MPEVKEAFEIKEEVAESTTYNMLIDKMLVEYGIYELVDDKGEAVEFLDFEGDFDTIVDAVQSYQTGVGMSVTEDFEDFHAFIELYPDYKLVTPTTEDFVSIILSGEPTRLADTEELVSNPVILAGNPFMQQWTVIQLGEKKYLIYAE